MDKSVRVNAYFSSTETATQLVIHSELSPPLAKRCLEADWPFLEKEILLQYEKDICWFTNCCQTAVCYDVEQEEGKLSDLCAASQTTCLYKTAQV